MPILGLQWGSQATGSSAASVLRSSRWLGLRWPDLLVFKSPWLDLSISNQYQRRSLTHVWLQGGVAVNTTLMRPMRLCLLVPPSNYNASTFLGASIDLKGIELIMGHWSFFNENSPSSNGIASWELTY